MKIGVPPRGEEPRVPHRDYGPAGVRELTGPTATRCSWRRTRARGSELGDDAYVRGRRHDHPRPPTRSGALADLVLKVKEPIAEEYHRMRPGPGALHLPAPGRRQGLHRRPARETRVTGIAYETVQLADGSLPLLAPMSEVAGPAGPAGRRLPPDAPGAAATARLLGGVPGTHASRVCRDRRPASSGQQATQIAVGLGAQVTVLDRKRRQAPPSSTPSTTAGSRPSRPTPTRSRRAVLGCGTW